MKYSLFLGSLAAVALLPGCGATNESMADVGASDARNGLVVGDADGHESSAPATSSAAASQATLALDPFDLLEASTVPTATESERVGMALRLVPQLPPLAPNDVVLSVPLMDSFSLEIAPDKVCLVGVVADGGGGSAPASSCVGNSQPPYIDGWFGTGDELGAALGFIVLADTVTLTSVGNACPVVRVAHVDELDWSVWSCSTSPDGPIEFDVQVNDEVIRAFIPR